MKKNLNLYFQDIVESINYIEVITKNDKKNRKY